MAAPPRMTAQGAELGPTHKPGWRVCAPSTHTPSSQTGRKDNQRGEVHTDTSKNHFKHEDFTFLRGLPAYLESYRL